MSICVDPDSFRSAMARFPGAVTVITALDGAERRGITATAVCSVSVEPPSLLACVNRGTGTCAAIAASGRFNVNVLRDTASSVAMRFAGQGGVTGEQKFQVGRWREDGRGLPALADALMVFSCDVAETTVAGSHSIFIGRIVDIQTGEGDPLLFERSRFHRLSPI